MVELSIEQDDLIVEVLGWSRLWALKGQLRVPLAHVRTIRADPTALAGWWKGWRVPGTHIPGLIVAGTFHRPGACEFWDVRRGNTPVTIELQRDAHSRIVVDVADPRAAIALIEGALARVVR